MPEFRRDPVTGRWVIMAPDRAARPVDFQPLQRRKAPGECPFCSGRESETPREIYSVRAEDSAPDSPGWQVRVVPNKYPALVLESQSDAAHCDLFQAQAGVGAHEVIIESPEHLASTSQLSEEAVQDVLKTCALRLAALRCDDRLRYGLIFKNAGAQAGATLEHIHSQLIALPMLPPAVCEELQGAENYRQLHGSCVFCDLIARELGSDVRVLFDDDQFVAICPYASRFPYETWILPKAHSSQFEDLADGDFGPLARILRSVIQSMEDRLDECAYNYLIHTAPFDIGQNEYYHWHVEVFPRVAMTAGFEWGTGCYINPVAPEQAAKRLRRE